MQYVIEKFGWIDNHFGLIDSQTFITYKEIKEKTYNKDGFTYCVYKLNEVQNKVSLINDCLFVFDYSKLFKEISVEDFSKCLMENFKDVTIDLFEEEINNIFLYIYFLKKNIYNEIAYKSIIGRQDDYI